MIQGNVITALALTLFAGLATGIGSALAFFSKKSSPRFLSVALGFSAGVMLYVSFMEIFTKSKQALISAWGLITGNWLAVAAFFAGILVIAFVDKLVPEAENPHEAHRIEELRGSGTDNDHRLLRTGTMTALAIAIHNFPEGLATFTAALQEPKLGIAIAMAIAIHNIPEGIAVSVPVFYATGNRKKAFALSFLSGLSEPLGAFAGYLVLRPFFGETLLGILFGMVAGIMVFISLDELLPTAREYGKHHLAIYGLVTGMAIMALSLLLFL